MLVDLVYNKICTKKYDIAMVRLGEVKYGGVMYSLARVRLSRVEYGWVKV